MMTPLPPKTPMRITVTVHSIPARDYGNYGVITVTVHSIAREACARHYAYGP